VRIRVLGAAAGIALAVALFHAFGTEGIGHAFAVLGWAGFAVVTAFHLGLIALMGVAWWLLLRGTGRARVWPFVWGRLVRDSVSQALPLSQVGGMVFGARALTATGTAGPAATASLIVDIGIEMAGLVAYALLGLGLLAWLRPANRIVGPIAGVLVVLAVLAGAFFAVQARGSGVVGGWVARVAGVGQGTRARFQFGLPRAIEQIHARYANLALAGSVHLVCWVLTAVQLWLTLRFMASPVRFGGAIVIDSLAFAIRGAAFMVPGGLGVQEGAYVLLGSMFGVGAHDALALSLVRRARDLAIAVPTLIAWQLHEGGWPSRAGTRSRSRQLPQRAETDPD
jgi:putative membrane protein